MIKIRSVRVEIISIKDRIEWRLIVEGESPQVPGIDVSETGIGLSRIPFQRKPGMPDPTTAYCPTCGWYWEYDTETNAKRGLSAHVRQMHPDNWKQSSDTTD